MAHARQRCQVPDCPHLPSAAPAGTGPAPGATGAVERGQPEQGGDVLHRAVAQLGQVGEPRQRNGRADRGHTARAVSRRSWSRSRHRGLACSVWSHSASHSASACSSQALGAATVGRTAGSACWQRLLAAVLLSGQHAHHLVAPRDQGGERLALGIRQGARLGVDGLGKVRQCASAAASSASVLASRPVALAKSRT
jgi:hypothetical protein